MTTLREAAQQALEYEQRLKEIEDLHSDPALHFCHRFAILMECMLLTNDSNLDKYWDEAHALLGEYHKAQEWWQHQMGAPYVSGFGKD